MIFLTKATVSKYESGSHDIPASVIAELTQVLKTTSDYLLLGRGGDEAAEDECIQILMKIKDPALKNLALMQLECIAALEEES